MKAAVLLLVVCFVPLRAQTIGDFSLDPHRIVDLPVSHEVTAVTLPGPITAIAGADMLIDDGKAAAEVDEGTPVRFHLTHIKGSNFFLVQSDTPGAVGTLTVIYNGSAYVIRLRSVSANPVASAIFDRPQAPSASPVAEPPEPVKFSPRIGLSLLDRAQAYPVLAQVLPAAVEGVTRRVQNRRIDLPNLSIDLREVCRFSREDAVVFLLHVTNKTADTLDLAPDTFAARVGDQKFGQAIANGPRTLPPGGSADAEFAVVGMPDGTRNDLSADNTFTILVDSRPRVAAASNVAVTAKEPRS